jgi:hypothetical protein
MRNNLRIRTLYFWKLRVHICDKLCLPSANDSLVPAAVRRCVAAACESAARPDRRRTRISDATRAAG